MQQGRIEAMIAELHPAAQRVAADMLRRMEPDEVRLSVEPANLFGGGVLMAVTARIESFKRTRRCQLDSAEIAANASSPSQLTAFVRGKLQSLCDQLMEDFAAAGFARRDAGDDEDSYEIAEGNPT